ncbi:hypothetical protein BCR32DRAFT_326856 [Anaeromyces robustus]|uniref:Phosphoglycerate mutase-like protein n=1 Tax=Anaeromyces robustus TaxID=1754192 RepID=A0A1Y1X9J8_9FUNG|nr:hypothetical protein BCR32DRAFT_326856 [Anaeromyces robustus]|eukprot:ORX82430.1 hypothetical protein BCR32DRAFT_326856 [Anaeromyces robustus]
MKFPIIIFLLGLSLVNAKLVMIIRHGEKISNRYTNLSPEGEARAKCLINLFGNNGTYVSPQKIYAQSPTVRKQSTRPRDTVIPLSNSLGIEINLSYSSNKIKKLVNDIKNSPEEIILVSWSRANIPEIARQLGADNPPDWENQFDEIWFVSDGKIPYLRKYIDDNNLIKNNKPYSKILSDSKSDYLVNQNDFNNDKNLIINSNYLLMNSKEISSKDGTDVPEVPEVPEDTVITFEIQKQNLEDCIQEELNFRH